MQISTEKKMYNLINGKVIHTQSESECINFLSTLDRFGYKTPTKNKFGNNSLIEEDYYRYGNKTCFRIEDKKVYIGELDFYTKLGKYEILTNRFMLQILAL